MQIGKYIIDPWNRKNAFWRILALAIVAAWFGWGFVIYQEGREIQARIQAAQELQIRRQETQRRQAAFQRAQEEQRLNQQGTRNVMDTLPSAQ